MNLYVCVKQVPDTETRIILKPDGQIDFGAIKWIVNPYDEFALEEAIRLKEQRTDCQVVVVTLGPERCQEAIRYALAMGADRGIHIVCEEYPEPNWLARALANAILADGACDLIFTGKQAIDDDGYQVHLRLAHFFKVAAATNVMAFELSNGVAQVMREIDEGAVEKLTLPLPAVIAVTKGINTPRYPTLPNIMKARKKEIKKITLSEVGLTEIGNRQTITRYTLPPARQHGQILTGSSEESVSRLVAVLKGEARVI